ncbi:hypothetical protein ACFVVL_18375 [Kitasatospora sp. NPDC058115]|uniref:hypothetical protein n=1 Tax=Kitasatospora sp. NPDC058115 TaxID=3346347 RepID=UPI0036D90AEF
MTTLDQTAADRPASAAPSAPPAPPVFPVPPLPDGSAGDAESRRDAGDAGDAGAAGGASPAGPAGGASLCSIAAAGADGRTAGTTGVLTGGSVPRPRGSAARRSGGAETSGEGGSGGGPDGGTGPGTGLGAGPERAGGRDGGVEGFVRLQQPPPARDRSVPVLRAAQEELRTVVTRRPAPSRRLRRMHPQAAGAPRPSAVDAGPVPPADVPSVPGPRTGGGDRSAPDARATGAEAPLGVLIGGTPQLPEAAGGPGPAGPNGRCAERPAVRATAELVRLGRGTCLVVLPAWRPAIAVSVPTEHLLNATGLAYERLAGARLSVVINPDALHDRELEPRDWRAGAPGRRGGRRAVQEPAGAGRSGTGGQERAGRTFGM